MHQGRGSGGKRWVMHHSHRCLVFQTGAEENARRGRQAGRLLVDGGQWLCFQAISTLRTVKNSKLQVAAKRRRCCKSPKAREKSQVKNMGFLKHLGEMPLCITSNRHTMKGRPEKRKKTKKKKHDGKQCRSSANCLFNIYVKRKPSRPFQA